MRKLFRSQPFSIVSRNAVPEYRPEINEQKLKSWSARLNSLSSKPASKVYLAQLSGLIGFYNKTVEDTTKPIDFPTWKSKIITKGLVDKVQTSFEQLSQHEYDLDKIFNEIFTKDSKSIDQINNQMAFHTAIWVENYCEYIKFLSDLETYSSPNDYSGAEQMAFFPGYESVSDALIETHNYLPGSKDDVNLFNYIMIQFSWGKRIVTFYRHPTEDMKAGRATKNTMGR